MNAIVRHGKHASEIHVSPIYSNTEVSLRASNKGVVLYQNDELLTLLTYPIMKIVHAIRVKYPEAKMSVI